MRRLFCLFPLVLTACVHVADPDYVVDVKGQGFVVKEVEEGNGVYLVTTKSPIGYMRTLSPAVGANVSASSNGEYDEVYQNIVARHITKTCGSPEKVHIISHEFIGRKGNYEGFGARFYCK